MSSGMSALISSVSRSPIAPVLRSVSELARAVLPRLFPDLGSMKVQWRHVTPPVDLQCGPSLAIRTSMAAGSLQIVPPLVLRDNLSRMIPGSVL